MDTRWFDDVLALLEEGSLSRAAARRAVTQPAFSRRIKAFEDWLGQTVIDRSTNRVSIKGALTRSEPEIRAFLRRLDDVRQTIRLAENAVPRVTFATQHSLTFSTFPDLLRAVDAAGIPLNYRLRTANRDDCISLIIRGDADALLCYETDDEEPLPLDQSFTRIVWAHDRMVPVAGGHLRYRVDAGRPLPPDLPLIVYPQGSYLGQTLTRKCSAWQTMQRTLRPVCETAFAAGVREMVLRGIGIAWLPMSLIWRDREAGNLVDLATLLGSCPLSICLYAKTTHYFSTHVLPALDNPGGRG